MSIWDDPDLRTGGEFIKLEKVGDVASGTIQAIRKHRFDDGSVVPQVLLVTDIGEERTLTCGQVRLKAELATQRPEAGDHITVTLSQIEPRAGGKSLKHFTVQIRKGTGQPAAPAPQQYAPQQPYPATAPQQQYAAPQPPPGYQAPPAAPAPQQQYTPAPAPAAAPPPAPAVPQLTPEQQAAMAALSPEQRVALGWPAT